MIETQVVTPKENRVRCDGTGELTTTKKPWCMQKRIKLTFSAPFQQMLKIFHESARAMMLRANTVPVKVYVRKKSLVNHRRKHLLIQKLTVVMVVQIVSKT